jgi:hypothetical protein
MAVCLELYNYHIREAQKFNRKLESESYEHEAFLQIEAFHIASAYNFILKSICIIEGFGLQSRDTSKLLDFLKEHSKNKNILNIDFLQQLDYDTQNWISDYNKYGKISNVCASQCKFYLQSLEGIAEAYNKEYILNEVVITDKVV